MALLYKLVGVAALGITENKSRTQVLRTNGPVLRNIDGDGHDNVT